LTLRGNTIVLWTTLRTALIAVGAALAAAGCGRQPEGLSAAAARDDEAIPVETAAVVQQPIARFIGVSGTLAAQEDADVAAEVAGRVVATPIERGSRVVRNATLIQIADAEVAAQAREAEANAAQIEARLGTASGAAFHVEQVAEVANARASYDLAERTSSVRRCCRSVS